jgi:hypothetical protein
MKDDTTPDQKNSALLESKDTSAATQRNQILAHLKSTPSLNTLELRELGFLSPAPRILELKERGHNINSIREDVRTPDGRLHRGIARYYLSNVPPANDLLIEVAS